MDDDLRKALYQVTMKQISGPYYLVYNAIVCSVLSCIQSVIMCTVLWISLPGSMDNFHVIVSINIRYTYIPRYFTLPQTRLFFRYAFIAEFQLIKNPSNCKTSESRILK